MHPVEIRCARLVLAIAALLCLLAAPAIGDERPWEQARWNALDAHFSVGGGDLSTGQRWMESQLHTTQEHGFQYGRSLGLNLKKRFTFSIQGPPAGEWAPGLAFEVRF